MLYALLLDRASISKVNGFIEADGTIRLYFTVEQAQEKLHRSRQSANPHFQGVGVQRIDLPSKARSWQTCDDHAQLPFQCEADTTEGRQRITVRIKVENRIFYAPQETQAPEGHIFTHRAIKTYLRTVNGGTE